MEVLIVVAIISILAGIVLFSVITARKVSRDFDRTVSLEQFDQSLQRYYLDHGSYPVSCGANWYSFSYTTRQPDGTCSGGIGLKFDNSTSSGFLDELYTEGYINKQDWNDPLNPTSHSDIQNCRYVIPCGLSKSDCQAGLCPPPQSYLLHCNLEQNSGKEANDGGTNDTLFEIIAGDPWICVTGTYN